MVVLLLALHEVESETLINKIQKAKDAIEKNLSYFWHDKMKLSYVTYIHRKLYINFILFGRYKYLTTKDSIERTPSIQVAPTLQRRKKYRPFVT